VTQWIDAPVIRSISLKLKLKLKFIFKIVSLKNDLKNVGNS